MTNHAEEMMSALNLGQVADAQKAFDLSLKEDSDDLVFSLAEDLYAMGFVDESKQAYLQLLAKHPDEDQLKSALAELAIEEDNLEEAQDYLAQISPESDAYLQALLVKADLYQQEGLQESAEYALKQARQIAPDEPVVAFALAEFYFSTGEYNKAIALYRSLLLMGQRRIAKVDIAARIGTAYAAVGNIDNAIAYFEQIKPIDMSVDNKFQLGFLYYQKGETAEAVELLEEVLDLDPHYTSVYPILGQAQEKANEKEAALKTYQAGLSYDQTNVVLFRLTANLAFQMGDDKLAEDSYKKALALDDGDVVTIAALADFYLAKHDYDQTIEVITDANKRDLFDPKFKWDLARAYHAKEEDDKAASYWQQAASDYPEDTDFLHDLADWYHETGQREEEAATLKKALAINPDNFELAERLTELEDTFF